MSQKLLIIPVAPEDSASFKERLSALLKANDTHIYVDTSFLMWMTKIGSNSRHELTVWLQKSCPCRVHVPIWAAHEYLKHHVAGTIIAELSEKTDEVADLVRRTYTYFRPFIDEPFGDGFEDPVAIRASARSALNTLEHLVATIRQWHRSYHKHAAEVIEFINAATPEITTIYNHFPLLSEQGGGRFIGSVPPGFQDRRKKGSSINELGGSDEDTLDGSNRYGDLVFWKELLDHAKTRNAKAIIILTNDRKNDWHLGRSESVNIDPSMLALRKTWKPVPRPHPMLVAEAKLVADVEQVELLDSPYLAALLHDIAVDQVRAFADVAIIPDGPEPKKESDLRAEALRERLNADAAKAELIAAENGFLFLDAPEVLATPAALRRALLESRAPIDLRGDEFLNLLRANVDPCRPICELITPPNLEGLDHKKLVTLARELHDRVVSKTPGYVEVAADLVSILHVLPTNTASCLYLGLLASMYLDRQTNSSCTPPISPFAQLLFERQNAPYAIDPVVTVSKRLRDNPSAPLYIPSAELPNVEVTLDIEPDSSQPDQLRSIQMAGVELLTPAQQDESLRLNSLFASQKTLDGDAIIRKACELFAVPLQQVERREAFSQFYTLTETIGFKRPVDVSIPKGEPPW